MQSADKCKNVYATGEVWPKRPAFAHDIKYHLNNAA